MLNSKFLTTLIGLIVAIFAICKMDFNGEVIKENWWNGAGYSAYASPSVYNTATGQESSLGVTVLNKNMMGNSKFVQVPNYQAMVSPRFGNVSYGANIRYNPPSRENQAVPCDPLGYGEMVDGSSKENYSGCGSCSGGCSAGSCGKGGLSSKVVAGGYELPSGYTAGNYQAEENKLPSSMESMGSNLPVGTMSTVDGDGNAQQHVVFDRLMFTNATKSRLYGQADFIRGDLAITPCNTGWFSVAPNLVRDVNPGAMAAMNGVDGVGSSNAATLNLLMKATGGTKSTFGGANLAEITPQGIQQNAQMTAELSAGLSDVVATAFP